MRTIKVKVFYLHRLQLQGLFFMFLSVLKGLCGAVTDFKPCTFL